MGWKKLGANPMKLSLACAYSRIIGQLFGARGGSKRSGKAELWQIPQGHPNRPFSETLQRGDQGKLGQKVGRLKGLEKTGRKCHETLIRKRLWYNHRTTFRRKRRLQKRPQSRVMTNSARTPKSPIFWDFSKMGPRETRPKSRPT